MLEALAAQFGPCMNYPECEVNALLSEAYDDFHALRTALVAEGLILRCSGVYRRAY